MKNDKMNNSKNVVEDFEKRQVNLALRGKVYSLRVQEQMMGERLQTEYFLYQQEEPVARTSVYYYKNDSEEKKRKHQWFGYSEVPESMFELDHVYVEPKYRGIGTPFMNIIMHDILQFDKEHDIKSKIVFIRLNRPETIVFFNKWDARVNENEPQSSDTTKMIIDNPKIVGNVEFEKIEEFQGFEK